MPGEAGKLCFTVNRALRLTFQQMSRLLQRQSVLSYSLHITCVSGHAYKYNT